MKAYKVEVLVLDNEQLGEDSIKYLLENVKWVYPKIMSIQSKEIGEWDDDHPLNKKDEAEQYYQELFGGIN